MLIEVGFPFLSYELTLVAHQVTIKRLATEIVDDWSKNPGRSLFSRLSTTMTWSRPHWCPPGFRFDFGVPIVAPVEPSNRPVRFTGDDTEEGSKKLRGLCTSFSPLVRDS